MAIIKWRLEAVQDIDRLRDFLYSKDLKAAQQAIHIIYNAAKRLENSPEIGKPMQDDTKRRELIIPFGAGAYIIRYVFENDSFYVLRIWHNRENRSN